MGQTHKTPTEAERAAIHALVDKVIDFNIAHRCEWEAQLQISAGKICGATIEAGIFRRHGEIILSEDGETFEYNMARITSHLLYLRRFDTAEDVSEFENILKADDETLTALYNGDITNAEAAARFAEHQPDENTNAN